MLKCQQAGDVIGPFQIQFVVNATVSVDNISHLHHLLISQLLTLRPTFESFCFFFVGAFCFVQE